MSDKNWRPHILDVVKEALGALLARAILVMPAMIAIMAGAIVLWLRTNPLAALFAITTVIFALSTGYLLFRQFKKPAEPRDRSSVIVFKERGGPTYYVLDVHGRARGFQDQHTYTYFGQTLGLGWDVPERAQSEFSQLTDDPVQKVTDFVESLFVYRTIDLPVHNTHYPRPEVPQGTFWLRNVEFHIVSEWDVDHRYHTAKGLKVQPGRQNQPEIQEVKVDLTDVCSVFLLLVAGNGYKSCEDIRFEGRKIGYIELVSQHGPRQTCPLILGSNIRGWNCYDPSYKDRVVGSLTDIAARPVWRSPNGYNVLDMLQVDIKLGVGHLSRIRIAGEFEAEARLAYHDFPAVNVFAITCRQLKQSPS
jgi:hypothetical protein